MLENLYKQFRQSAGVTTDSRNVAPNQIYFALKGDNFDGNAFAAQALDKGALAAVVDDASVATSDRYFLVPNVLNALQDLARMHRQHMRARVFALTGSNGKTTTKELISAVLSTSYRIVSTQGNLNNHIGVPLTLLRIENNTEIAVVEMGANHIGEIDFLCRIAEPDAGLITNIGKAHLEGFGSFEGVIQAKTEMYRYLASKNGTIFVNSNNEILFKHLPEKCDIITYGKDAAEILGKIENTNPTLALLWRKALDMDWKNIQTQIPGEYNFENFLAALAVGSYFHVAPELMNKALSEYNSTNKRSQFVQGTHNKILLDAYNANPTSMTEALRNFAGMKHDKPYIILGDMFELGSYAAQEHRYIVELALSLGLQEGVFIGKHFFEVQSGSFHFFNTKTEAIDFLKAEELKNKTILLKASRGMALEQLVEWL